MSARARRIAVDAAAVAVVLLLVWFMVTTPRPDASGGEGEPRGGGSEVEEELSEATEERLEALTEANEQGIRWQVRTKVAAAAAAPAPGWAGEVADHAVGRLGAGDRGRSERARSSTLLATRYGAPKPCPGNCPIAVDRARGQLRRRRDLGAATTRSAPARAPASSTRSSRSSRDTGAVYARLHERLQRRVHEVDRPRRDVVGAGQDLRQRQLERQAGHRDERQRPGRLRLVQRPDRRRSVDAPSPTMRARRGRRRSSSTRTATSSRSTPTSPRTGPSYFAESRHPVRRRRQQGHRAERSIEPPRVRLARQRRDVGGPHRGDTVQPGVACDAAGCTPDFYIGHTALSVDDGRRTSSCSTTARRPSRGPADGSRRARSTDGGATWSSAGRALDGRRERHRAGGRIRGQPATSAPGTTQTSGGGNDDAWNVWYRTLEPTAARRGRRRSKISDVGAGAAYKTAARVPRGLRRLRRDRDHEHGQDDRDLGRGPELRRTRRGLDQPPELSAQNRRRGHAPSRAGRVDTPS